MTQASRLPAPADLESHGLDAGKWKVLVEAIFPAAKTPEGILMAVDYCQARGLDVFKRPVNIVSMWNAALSRKVETVWPGINELQVTAARTGQWAGMDSPKWGTPLTRTFAGRVKNDDKWEERQIELTFPEWCEVTVYRLIGGRRCAFIEPVYWLETYSRQGGRWSELPTDMWVRRPRGQLHKCAKAASLRAAFPEECGYAAEEMEGKVIDTTSEEGVIEGDYAEETAEPSPPLEAEISPNSISEKVKAAIDKLIERAEQTGAWQAASDWAKERLSGPDLAYALSELDKAKAAAEKAAA